VCFKIPVIVCIGIFSISFTQQAIKAFPDAQGWAAYTSGGRGGQIIKVTNLQEDGPGSLKEAIEAPGPRIVVFEVGGIINLESGSNTALAINEPFLTIAGQTAPSPGITIIRKGLEVKTHDVIIQHIRVRPGEAGHEKNSGWEVDAMATSGGAFNVIIDHCSVSWGTDENLSASGPRFEGADLTEWRLNTSHRITFSNNIISEGLLNSTHAKGAHSRGSLIHDNVTEMAIIGNLYAHNNRRNPFFKGGASGIIVCNLIYNPGVVIMHQALQSGEWGGQEYVTSLISAVSNYTVLGPNSNASALFREVGDGTVELFMDDNTVENEPVFTETSGNGIILLDSMPVWPDDVKMWSSSEVKDSVLLNAGARPWDRDDIDKRIIQEVQNGTGKIIDSQQEVGGYPQMDSSYQSFNIDEWDTTYMIKKQPSNSVEQGLSHRGFSVKRISDQVFLTFKVPDDYVIAVTGLSGKTQRSFKVFHTRKISFSTTSFPAGVYIITARSANNELKRNVALLK